MKKNVYPIENAITKLINEIRLQLVKIVKFFFEIPKSRMDKYIYIMESLAWISLTMALILRIFR